MSGFQGYDQWKTASPFDDEAPEPVEGAINNIDELATSIGTTVQGIGKALFKGSECGIVFTVLEPENEATFYPPHGVSVCGYAEGADAECVPKELLYPFTMDQFWSAAQSADDEGVELWEEWNQTGE